MQKFHFTMLVNKLLCLKKMHYFQWYGMNPFIWGDICASIGVPGGLVVKNLPASAGDTGDAGLVPGSEDPLEQEMSTHSSSLP